MQQIQQQYSNGESLVSQDSLPNHFELLRILTNENAKSAGELILDLKSELDPESLMEQSASFN